MITTKNDSHNQLLAPRVGVNHTRAMGFEFIALACSRPPSLLARSGHVRDAASTDVRVLGIPPHIRTLVPAAHALRSFRRTRDDPGSILLALFGRYCTARTIRRRMNARVGR